MTKACSEVFSSKFCVEVILYWELSSIQDMFNGLMLLTTTAEVTAQLLFSCRVSNSLIPIWFIVNISVILSSNTVWLKSLTSTCFFPCPKFSSITTINDSLLVRLTVFCIAGLEIFQYAVRLIQSFFSMKLNILVVPFFAMFKKSVISKEYNLMLSE